MAEVDMFRSFIHRCESLISELGLKLYKIGSSNTDTYWSFDHRYGSLVSGLGLIL